MGVVDKVGYNKLPDLVTFERRNGKIVAIVGGFEFSAGSEQAAAEKLVPYLQLQAVLMESYIAPVVVLPNPNDICAREGCGFKRSRHAFDGRIIGDARRHELICEGFICQE